MSTLNISTKLINDGISESLYKNLKKSFGKSIALQAGLKTNKILIQKDYFPSSSEMKLDAIIYSNSNNMIIGFLVLSDVSFVENNPKIIEALKHCHKLYLVTDLKERDKLYDLLDMNDLDQVGVVGRMSNHQFVLCKTAKSQTLPEHIVVDKITTNQSEVIERKRLESIYS
ncbi:hypothetical protein [Flammeovirga sp. SJP92]|uniref:hypothetical protein n=1 Tax=Flammeovirga sp. SJP92 TaxID=1775430 RepID=UPI0007895256|nr:hypothetical protein [Flammeovirga sp. SJP92]KXX67274.1 hypothetical protein AVL50_28210 [Flammeovirga sp. SJP92]